MVKDPVCGMEVDEKSTPHISNYAGASYYFCSAVDKGKFDANPDFYLKVRVANVPKEGTHGQHDAHDHMQNQELSVAKPAHVPQGHKDLGAKEGEHHGSHEGHSVEGFRNRFWISLFITVPILLLSPMLQEWVGLGSALHFPGDLYLLFAFSALIFFYGGYPFLKGFVDEMKSRRPGMMTLIAIAISTAFVYSAVVVFGLKGEILFWETATLIDIMLLGHWIEMKSVLGASKALEELAKLMPSDAHKIMPDGNVRDIPLGELVAGDRVMVKPGEKVPADGDVVGGESSVNESMLTGESNPVSKKPGAKVIGGAINGEGSLTVEIKRTGKESFLSQVIDLVKEAQESKSRSQDLANRAALWLTIVALTGGVITLFIWLVVVNQSLAFALERTVTVMVIACPHALGLAIPLVIAVSTALSAKHGLLIRNRAAFEMARKIQAIIFDRRAR